jgi:flagellar biosynthesis protein FlhB
MATDRTEKPTPKRREEAREKGQIARRPELPLTFSFLATVLMLSFIGDDLLKRASNLFTGFLPLAADMRVLTPLTAHNMLLEVGENLALFTLPIVVIALVTSISINFAQGGLTFTPQALMPKAERFNPVENFKRIFGSDGPIEFLKGILKLAGIIALSYGTLMRVVAEAPAMIGAPAPQILTMIGSVAYDLAIKAGTALVLLAILDYAYGYYKHEKSLRMTKQEIKDEFRQQEGDPMVRSQRRRKARETIQRYLATEVKRANVIVMNPTHFAVALRYDKEQDAAPIVVAKGADFVAKRIREIAKENDIPVVENPPLARTLFRAVEVGSMIPPELYRAVAELLAYVFQQRDGKNAHAL